MKLHQFSWHHPSAAPLVQLTGIVLALAIIGAVLLLAFINAIAFDIPHVGIGLCVAISIFVASILVSSNLYDGPVREVQQDA